MALNWYHGWCTCRRYITLRDFRHTPFIEVPCVCGAAVKLSFLKAEEAD